MLESYLERLNAAVAEHNAEVNDAVESTLLTPAEAAALLWKKPITAETVRNVDAWNEWPVALLNIVDGVHTTMHSKEMMKLAKSVKEPTTITRELCQGAARSKGAKDADWEHPLMLKLIQAAHLLARADAGPTKTAVSKAV